MHAAKVKTKAVQETTDCSDDLSCISALNDVILIVNSDEDHLTTNNHFLFLNNKANV